MASTYSTNLGIELIGTGDQSGTWGATTNTNFGTLVEQAIVGYSTQAVTDSGVATALLISNGASSTGRNYVIELTGALTAARTVTVPAVNKPYTFFNNTTGGFAVTVKVSGQTGVTIANGKKAIVYTNSTDVIEVANAPVTEAGTQTLTNKTLTSPTLSGTVTATTITSPASTALTIQSAGTTAMTVNTSQYVGIGTTSPAYNLHVAGGSGASVIYSSAPAGQVGYVSVAGNGNTFGSTSFDMIQNATSTFLYNRANTPMVFGVNNAEAMRIDSSGNVGIGTSSPGRKLDIQQVSTDYQMRIGDAGGNYYDIGRNTGNGLLTFNGNQAAASGYVFSTVNGERMRIDTLGNVGIGTSSPGSKFEVSSSSNVIVNSRSTGGYAAFQRLAPTGQQTYDFYTINGVEAGRITVDGSNFMAFATGSYATERMRLDTSGSLQINTTTLGGIVKFGAYSSTADAATYAQIMRNSAGTDLFVVRSDGLFITGNAANSPYNFTTAAPANVTIDGNGWMYRSTSSSRYKINVQDYGKGLADLIKLRPVTFNSKPRDGDDTPNTKTYAGFIAEEVDAAGLTEFVQYNADNQPDALAYANMVALLTAAIQELSAKNDALEARLAKLETVQ
jgi:hypothetical protein